MANKQITKDGEPFFFLEVMGSDYEIGRQIGHATAADITEMWENFTLPRMADRFGTVPAEYDRTCRWFRENLEDVYPAAAERIDGIAAGSGLDIEKIWMMNHYAVLWSANGLFCTSAALRDSDSGRPRRLPCHFPDFLA
jgi:hypothetical protein